MTEQNMENNQNSSTEGTDTTGTNTTQDTGKTFTQDELNAIVAKRVAATQKRYEDIDVSEYQELKSAKEKAEQEQMMKRQEFDKLLKQTAEKKDLEINNLRSELLAVRVDGALVNAASKHKATNPEHVAKLLRDNVRLDETGQPVVLDANGEIRYNTDTGEPVGIDDVVNEFINSNPYFKSAGRPGSSSSSNTSSRVEQEFDLNTLADKMRTDPKAREAYRKLMKEGKI